METRSMPTQKIKKTAKKQPAYQVPEEALRLFRKRKAEKGVLLGRSLVDALSFACRNVEAWW
jgi:hypothetical protein